MHALVIENDKLVGALLVQLFHEAGYAVDLAAMGEEGQELLRLAHYDVVVLAIMLPGKSGIDVCRSLRKEVNWIPVVMLTCLDGLEDLVAGLDCGADAYITKPFRAGALFATIRAILRRSPVAINPRLTAADLTIDLNSREVWRGTERLDIVGKELSLLDLFMRHPDQPVPFSRISESIWAFSDAPSAMLIGQHVKNLRNKITAGDHRCPIETIRGVGYRFNTHLAPFGSVVPHRNIIPPTAVFLLSLLWVWEMIRLASPLLADD
jgi:DNA-binding response OmpR family regulator